MSSLNLYDIFILRTRNVYGGFPTLTWFHRSSHGDGVCSVFHVVPVVLLALVLTLVDNWYHLSPRDTFGSCGRLLRLISGSPAASRLLSSTSDKIQKKKIILKIKKKSERQNRLLLDLIMDQVRRATFKQTKTHHQPKLNLVQGK